MDLSGGSGVPCDGRPSESYHLVSAGGYGRGNFYMYFLPLVQWGFPPQIGHVYIRKKVVGTYMSYVPF
jgi:hypothetical protein